LHQLNNHVSSKEEQRPAADSGRQPLVYIVLVNWNGKAVTLDCLASLNTISYSNWRAVLVDNGSTDGSVDAIRTAYPDVTVLEMKKNLRYAGGANVGIRYAVDHGAELVLTINNDTTVHPEFLAHLVNRIESDSTIGMVAPKIYYHDDPKRLWFAGASASMWTGTMRHFGIREIDRGQYDTPRELDHISGCCLLVRKEVIEMIGLFDEAFYLYAEDADWAMRCRRAGFRLFYEPRAMIWHKISADSGGHLSWYKMKNKWVGNFRFFGRYASWYHWLVFPWMNILVNAWAALRFILFKATARRQHS
jgi:GT2 family glycosyltransferase